MTDADEDGSGHEFTVVRAIEAPIAAVWQAWTDPDQVKEWWGPRGFTAAVSKMDFRVDGTTLVSMSAPEFGTIYNTWTYTRIDPQRRIEFASRFADANGGTIDPIAPGVPDEVPHVVTFKDLGDGRTELRVTESGYTIPEAMAMSRAGQEQVLDKLAESVERR